MALVVLEMAPLTLHFGFIIRRSFLASIYRFWSVIRAFIAIFSVHTKIN